MDREIKFRVYDLLRGKIVSPELCEYYFSNNQLCIGNSNWAEEAFGNYPIMQYTGLKDKNGKEIYEGDIVEFKTNYTNKKGGWLNGVVIWDSERYGWALNAENTIYDIYDETEGFEYIVKHIGNIYENPELLTNN